ncbi:MAG: hypothetical protein F4X64_08685 [Chloroflexi bacterium]|nr:hypothetical protein [Chloroflexota bacterium]
MQDQFVGDIGDFAKFSLLRWLCGLTDLNRPEPKLKLGVVWYYNNHPRKGGNHTCYPACRDADPELYDTLQGLLCPSRRNVRCLQKSGVLPEGTRFFREEMTYPPQKPQREAWLGRAVEKMQKDRLVYLDPDTGLAPESMKDKAHTKEGSHYAYKADVAKFWKQGHSLVIYQDATQGGNNKPETIHRKMEEIRAATDNTADVVALRWNMAGSGRVFLVAAQQKHRDALLNRIDRLPSSMKAGCFERVLLMTQTGGA